MPNLSLTPRDVARELARRYSTMTHDELDAFESILVPMKFAKGEKILGGLVIAAVSDDRSVDLQVVGVDAHQVLQIGDSGTEVIDRDHSAELMYPVNKRSQLVIIIDILTLKDLEDKVLRIWHRGELVIDHLKHLFVLDITDRDVDADALILDITESVEYLLDHDP